MNLDVLFDKIVIRRKGFGIYRISIFYRNKWYSVSSNNTLAYDRINNNYLYGEKQSVYGYTLRQAYLSFYNEVKSAWYLK